LIPINDAKFFHETVDEGKDQPPDDCRDERIHAGEAFHSEHECGCAEEEEYERANAQTHFEIAAFDEDRAHIRAR
jgi:hypothetical protein